MKNITVTVSDELYHKARLKAAECRTTISAVVRKRIEEYAGERETIDELLKRIRAANPNFSAADRLTRDEIHDRDALRRRERSSI